MIKGQDAFERSLKATLEQYEVPYNSADWAQMEKRLDDRKKNNWTSSAALYMLLLGGSLAVATTVQQLVGGTNTLAEKTIEATTVQKEVVPDQLFTTITVAPEAEVIKEPTIITNETQLVPIENTTTRGTDVKPRSTAQIQMANAGTSDDAPAPKPASTAVAIRPSITVGCPGATVEFSVDNMPKTGMHLWNFGDGSFSNKPSPEHTFSKAGTYEVMLSHSSTSGGSIENKPASDLIVIYEAPEAQFKPLKQEYDNTVPSVHFENRSQGAKSYLWDFGDGSTSSIAHPDHVFKKKGSYPVTLTVTNSNGCIDRTEQTLRIEDDYDLFAPKTFSPNDDGRDDVFIPEALKTLGVKFRMTIYNTNSGQLVHETRDIAHPWNGRIENKGELCSTGDYMWMVEMKDGDKLGGSYTGTVSLVR